MERRQKRGDGMKTMRWAGLAAVVGGMLMTLSDLLNLTVYVPGLGEAAHTGYQAVGSGVLLLALTLLLVGMVGLFARFPRPGGPRVLEYGDAHVRYVLVEDGVVPAEEYGAGRDGRFSPELRSAGTRQTSARGHRPEAAAPERLGARRPRAAP